MDAELKFKKIKQVILSDYASYYEIDFYKHNTHKILKIDFKDWWLIQDKIISWIRKDWDKIDGYI